VECHEEKARQEKELRKQEKGELPLPPELLKLENDLKKMAEIQKLARLIRS